MTVRVGRVMGVPVEIHATWVIIFLLLSYFIGFGFLAQIHEDLSALASLAAGAIVALSLFACLIVHEFAHVGVAQRYGIRTRSVSLFLFGGSAELSRDPDTWRQELAVALAGPAASLAMAALFLLASMVLTAESILSTMVFYLAFANALLAAVNLIPSYPLDGGRALKAVIWCLFRNRTKATHLVTIAGQCTGIGAAACGAWLLFHSDTTGLWLLAVGWYLADSAARAWEREQVHTMLEHSCVCEILTDHPTALSPEDCIECLSGDLDCTTTHSHVWPVVDESGPVGILTESSAKRATREARVSEVMARLDQDTIADPEDNAWDVVERVGDLGDNDAVMVAYGKSVFGVVEKRELPALLTTRLHAMAH